MSDIKKVDIPVRQLVVGFKRDYFGYLQTLINRYGSVFSFPFKPHTAIVIMEPKLINHILVENKNNYIKGADLSGTAFNYLKAALGENIFLTDNKKLWEKHRKIIMPNLQRSHYTAYAEQVAKNCEIMLADWEQQRLNQQPINVTDTVSNLALQNLLHTLLKDNGFDAEALLEFTRQMKFARQAASFKKLTQLFDKLVYDYVRMRLKNAGDKHDMLAELIAAYGDEINTEAAVLSICNEIKGILIAGHETVAAALTWTCYLLSHTPAIQEQIKEECDAAFGNNSPTYDGLENIPFTVATFKEALRLYPPIYTISRVAVNEDVINDITIPKGGYIMIPVFHLQRDPHYWQDADVFQPERFLEDDIANAMPAYLPFGAGERACIGREFAMMEASISIAMIVSRYQISMADERVLALEAANSLWPTTDLKLNLNPLK